MTKTPFTVTAKKFGETMTVATKSRKDLAIKAAEQLDADYVYSPKGSVVWTNPAIEATGRMADGTVAQDEEVSKDESMTATIEATEPTVKTRRQATRATAQNPNATTGRFELANYDKESGETSYAQRPDAILRAMLGIKWRELWALGYTQKVSSKVLAELAAGDLDIDTLRDEVDAELEALAAEDGEDA